MDKLEIESSKEFKKHINPDTTEFECFFHYTDERIFRAGFEKGAEFGAKEEREEIREWLLGQGYELLAEKL